MTIITMILIAVAALAAVVALIRGLIAFANMNPQKLGEDGIIQSHKKQNQMMFARIKYQAIAVILIALLLFFAGAQS